MRSPTNASTSEECPEANDISLPIRPKAADVTLPLASRKCRSTRGRSRTLGAPGDFANLHQLLTRETEVEGLHRALAESREEALLAARIGQTLLERNQEMDAEIERKDIALSSRAEYAEHEAKALENRLKSAHNQIRVLEVARVKAIDETERLADELEHHRLRQVAWQTQLAKSRDEIKQLEDAKYAADQASERVREELATLQSAHAHLADDYAALARRMHEQLSATEQFHQERLQLLENDSVFHRQQKHAVERRERVLRSENEQITAQLIAQESALRDQVAHTGVLNDTIDRLTEELDDVKDALRQEQLRVAQLHEKTRELEDQLSWQQGMDLEQQFETISPTSRLRSGSLFFELSRELTTDRLSLPEPPAQPMHVTKQPENQVAIEERRDTATSPVKPAAADETPSDTTEATEDCPTPARSCENHNILKEFFMLTAAAVKITGAGLGNDTCNIHNEELYEEAMSQDITFDQYHIWLVARLEGANKSE